MLLLMVLRHSEFQALFRMQCLLLLINIARYIHSTQCFNYIYRMYLTYTQVFRTPLLRLQSQLLVHPLFLLYKQMGISQVVCPGFSPITWVCKFQVTICITDLWMYKNCCNSIIVNLSFQRMEVQQAGRSLTIPP